MPNELPVERPQGRAPDGLVVQPDFLLGAHRIDQLPADHGREVAIAGRSNAGKSSAINAMFQIRGLARTSKTPGRTQQINVFSLGDGQRLVDLPGYGYAKVSPALREHWARTLPRYLSERRSLAGVLLAMDIRHPLKDSDIDFISWCVHAGLGLRILLTKSDKLARGARQRTHAAVHAWCETNGHDLSVQLFSSLRREGLPEARRWIREQLLDAGADLPAAPAPASSAD
jgi:GTP-binding protein